LLDCALRLAGNMNVVKNIRNELQQWLNSHSIEYAFHLFPIYSSTFGRLVSRFVGKDVYTTKESERRLRFPIHNCLTVADIERIVNT